MFSFNFFSERPTSCSTRIRAFVLFPFTENNLVFLSIFVYSLTLVLNEDASSFATHSFAFSRDCSFRRWVCFPDLYSLSAWGKKKCSSSATSQEKIVTPMGVVCMSARILRRIFSATLSSSLERKSAAALTDTAMSATLKVNCNTSSDAFHSAGRIAFV